MLNAEKYKKEILEILDCDYGCEGFGVTKDKEIIACAGGGCCVCSFLKNDFCNPEAKTRWLLSEYKKPVKLTRLEHDILKWAKENTQFEYLVRNECGTLYASSEKPSKDYQYLTWTYRESNHECLSIFDNLFGFVHCEDKEPTSIKDILENCEVIDGESE